VLHALLVIITAILLFVMIFTPGSFILLLLSNEQDEYHYGYGVRIIHVIWLAYFIGCIWFVVYAIKDANFVF